MPQRRTGRSAPSVESPAARTLRRGARHAVEEGWHPAAAADRGATAGLGGAAVGVDGGDQGACTVVARGTTGTTGSTATLLQKHRNHTCQARKTFFTRRLTSRGTPKATSRTPPRPRRTQIPAVPSPPALSTHQRPCSACREFKIRFFFQLVRHQTGHPNVPDGLVLQNAEHVNGPPEAG